MKHIILYSIGILLVFFSCETDLPEVTDSYQLVDDTHATNAHLGMTYITSNSADYLKILTTSKSFSHYRNELGEQFTLKNFRIIAAKEKGKSIINIPISLDSTSTPDISLVAIIQHDEVQDVYSMKIDHDQVMLEKGEKMDDMIYHLF